MPIHDVSMPESVTIYTDGAVSGNGTAGSYGGWAVVVVVGTQERELSGAERGATNQQMELRAAIKVSEATATPSLESMFEDVYAEKVGAR